MQAFLLSSEGRLRHWKEFRRTLDGEMTDEEQLLNIINYWKQYPVVNRYIDPYTPEEWPTAWELIYENEFCRSSFAYMMEQTLLLVEDGRWTEDRLLLKYIDDSEWGGEFIILVVDNKYVLNYDNDQIFKLEFINKSCILRHEYLIKENIHAIKQ